MSSMLSPLTQFAAPEIALPQIQSPWALQPQNYSTYGTGSFTGSTPYDKWLYSQNQRLQNVTLPHYPTQYQTNMPGVPINAAPSGNVYQPPQPVTPQAPTPQPPSSGGVPNVAAPNGLTTFQDGSRGYAAGYGGTVIGGGTLDANGNYILETPLTAAEQTRRDQRTALQQLVGAGDQAAVLRYMADNNLDATFFADALNYSGSPTSGRTSENWLIGAAQNTGADVRGLSYASPEEVQQFLAWQQAQTGLTGTNIGETWAAQGITDPYADQRLTDSAQEIIAREKRLLATRQGYTPEYQTYSTPARPLTQLQSNPSVVAPVTPAASAPAYQQVAGQFINEDTGDIVTYDSNGVHTSTGQIDPAWASAHQAPAAAPVVAPPAQVPEDRWNTGSDNRARGGLIQKYAVGGGVQSLAGKYNVY